MKNVITIIKNLLPICFLFVITITNGQQKKIANSEKNKLKNTLSAAHKTELKSYFNILESATNSLDSAKVYNDIATVHLKSSYYLTVSKYDSVHYYANKALYLSKNDKTVKGIQQYLISRTSLLNFRLSC